MKQFKIKLLRKKIKILNIFLYDVISIIIISAILSFFIKITVNKTNFYMEFVIEKSKQTNYFISLNESNENLSNYFMNTNDYYKFNNVAQEFINIIYNEIEQPVRSTENYLQKNCGYRNMNNIYFKDNYPIILVIGSNKISVEVISSNKENLTKCKEYILKILNYYNHQLKARAAYHYTMNLYQKYPMDKSIDDLNLKKYEENLSKFTLLVKEKFFTENFLSEKENSFYIEEHKKINSILIFISFLALNTLVFFIFRNKKLTIFN